MSKMAYYFMCYSTNNIMAFGWSLLKDRLHLLLFYVLLNQQYYGIWMEFTKGSSSFGMGGGVASFIGGLSSS
jgi:hypothetical protein